MGNGMKKRKRIDLTLAERLGHAFDIPVEAITDDVSIEIHGQSEACFNSCCGLADFCSEKVIMNVKRGAVAVCGNGLSVSSFVDGRIIIRGKIQKLQFCENTESAYGI